MENKTEQQPSLKVQSIKRPSRWSRLKSGLAGAGQALGEAIGNAKFGG